MSLFSRARACAPVLAAVFVPAFAAVFVLGLGVLVLTSACAGPQSPPAAGDSKSAASASSELDLEAARHTVASFAIAVVNQNRDEVRRVFSLRALASSFRPQKIGSVSPTLQARFNDEAMALLLDPKGAVYPLVAGLEVGPAHREGRKVVVLAKSMAADAGTLRFLVISRDGGTPRILRIE